MQAFSNFKTRLTRSIAIAMVGVLIPTVARSDWYPNFAPSNMQVITNSAINGAVLQNIVRRNAATRSNTTRSSQNQSTKGTTNLSFRPNSAISRQVQRSIVESVRQQVPSEADKFASILASGQPMSVYSNVVAKYGLRVDNVADAMTAFMVTNWLIVNNVRTDPSRASVQAVRSQIVPVVLNNPQFRSEQTRQLVAESLIYQTIFLNANYERASNNPAQMQQFVQTTHRSMTAGFGLDFRRIDLTDAGFRPRS
ncbi:hypothetical protein LEP3755_47500 [Leptolyngbya sp. NIES-3755]|nr:hypothetical protein LEP3755_47500 [Leptolyngbya sp. NIES-3755]